MEALTTSERRHGTNEAPIVGQTPINGLACPDCGARLHCADDCDNCGLEFHVIGNRVALFPTSARQLRLHLPADACNPSIIPCTDFLRFPPRHGQEAVGPYHLDQAHADVLEALPKGARLLDIGCGGAQMRSWAQSRNLDYLGVDIADDRVHDWLRDHGGPDLFCDAHTLPLADASFDAVYSAAVWEHLAFPHIAASEVARVLKPGGVFIGSMSFLEPWHDQSYFHMTPNGIWVVLRQAGLEARFIWPEVNWTGFRALLEMGNKATQPLRPLGWMMNGWYLTPKVLQFALRHRRWPTHNDLIRTVANLSGAFAWIACKPTTQSSFPEWMITRETF